MCGAQLNSFTDLCEQLGLETLKGKAYEALKLALTKENIVDELFSDFTWRFVYKYISG